MPSNASAVVLAGNGTNCEIETAYACRLAGFERVDVVTVWELLHGGFLDGDDLGAAKAQANRLVHSRVRGSGEPLFQQLIMFIRNGKLILGICNGFQLMVKLGLLPAFDGDYSQQSVTLTHNDSGRFEDRWVWLKANPRSPCVYTRGLDTAYLPVRHGEGKFVARDTETLDRILTHDLAAFTYVSRDGRMTMSYPGNPNGSQAAIAGICDLSGRLFGLMPHPEAYTVRTNHPRWTREEIPDEGMGLVLFRNARQYVRENL
jgi:phosphoribosylformylglycinamidine synthase